MKVDLYTKIVLTIIALSLGFDAVERAIGTHTVMAQSAKPVSDHRKDSSEKAEPKPIHVVIDGVSGTALLQGIPVTASVSGLPVRIEVASPIGASL